MANRAREERHTLTAVATATGFGMLEKYAPQALDALSIGPLGPTATLGLGAWFANRWFKSRVLEHVATGLLCVAGYNLAKTGFTASEGDWIGE